MQELLEKRAQNREKQRKWREKNLERSRELKRISNWNKRGFPQPRVYIEKPPKIQREIKPKEEKVIKLRHSPSIHSSSWIEDKLPDIEVALCMTCFRKYLPKLYCLWCNNKNYECRSTNRNDARCPQ